MAVLNCPSNTTEKRSKLLDHLKKYIMEEMGWNDDDNE